MTFKMNIISRRKRVFDTDVTNDVTRSRQSVITRVVIDVVNYVTRSRQNVITRVVMRFF